jgi:hypothetical protein
MTEYFAESSAPAGRAKTLQEAAARRRAGRNRAGGLAVAAVSLLAVAAAGCSSGSRGHAASGDPVTAKVATGITVPARIGPLTRGADGPMDDTGGGIPKPVLKNLRSVSYAADGGGDPLHSVDITGGPGLPIPSDGPTDKVARLFSEWDVGSAGAKLASVSPGSAGGTAECAPYDTKFKHLDCGWVSGKVALVLNFNGYNTAKVSTLLPQILSAMATR